jgi:hypothetical protein
MLRDVISAAADRDLVGIGLRQMDLVLGEPRPVADHLRIVRLGWWLTQGTLVREQESNQKNIDDRGARAW